MNNKKVLVLISAIILMIMALGTSYAFFTYDQTSTKSHSILMGDIELHYNDGQDTISLSNAFPMSKEKARTKDDNYITFTIDGTNQSGKDINYEIDLIYGDEISGKNRISDQYLVFDLEEDNFLVVNAGSYEDISNYLSIWTNTIPGNTNSNVTKNYKLRMWISDKIVVSDSDEADYTTTEYKNLYASIKVRVLGDFAEHDFVPANIAQLFIKNAQDGTGIDFSKPSGYDIASSTYDIDKNGRGIYKYNNDIAYFRGAVENNYLLFANFCWKVVRTTDTGGLKLVYNGTPDNGQCTVSSDLGNIEYNYNSSLYESVGYMYEESIERSTRKSNELKNSYLYGNDVTWSGSSYILTDTMASQGKWSQDYTTLSNNHYTCFTTGSSCTSVYYIYYGNSSRAYYIVLTNGLKIEDIIENSFTDSSNITSSLLKTFIDSWYEENIASNQEYTSKIDDVVYCNDRSIKDFYGWNPNGGAITDYLTFNSYGKNSNLLSSCPNKSDSFTVNESSIGNGKLTYPIGLLTIDDVILAGASNDISNTTYYLSPSRDWWIMSPSYLSASYGNVYYVTGDGALSFNGITNVLNAARPSITLNPSAKIINGDGTSTNPYIVE